MNNVVIDNGSDTIKAGYVSESNTRPDIVFPTLIRRPTKNAELEHLYCENDENNLPEIFDGVRPIQRRQILDWDGMEKVCGLFYNNAMLRVV